MANREEDAADVDPAAAGTAFIKLLQSFGLTLARSHIRVAQEAPSPPRVDQAEAETCRSIALAWLKAIRVNEEIFGPALVNAPAWVMMVELYVSERKMSVTDLATASGAPATTGLRHIQALEKMGFVYREPSKTDGRRIYVRLTSQARERIETAFLRTAESDKKLGLGRLKLA